MGYKNPFNPNPVVSFYAPEDKPEKLALRLNLKAMSLLGIDLGSRFVRVEIIEGVTETENLFRIINDSMGTFTVTIHSGNGNGKFSAASFSSIFKDGDAFGCEKCDNGIQFKYRRR